MMIVILTTFAVLLIIVIPVIVIPESEWWDESNWEHETELGLSTRNDAILVLTPGENHPYHLFSGGSLLYNDEIDNSWTLLKENVLPYTRTQIGDVNRIGDKYYMANQHDYRISNRIDVWNKNSPLVQVFGQSRKDQALFYENGIHYTFFEYPKSTRDGDYIGVAMSTEFGRFENMGIAYDPPYPTGDPDIVKVDNTYYMVLDNDLGGDYVINLLTNNTANPMFGWVDRGTIRRPTHGWAEAQDPDLNYVPKFDRFYLFYHQFFGVETENNHRHVWYVSSKPEKKPKEIIQ